MATVRWVSVLMLWLWAHLAAADDGVKLEEKIKALQQVFCGQESQETITKKLDALVEQHLAALPPEQREKLPPRTDMVASIKEQVFSTFHVNALCIGTGIRPFEKHSGIINGYMTGSFLDNYGFTTLIHEGGHAALAHMVYSDPNPQITIVKFQVFYNFCRDVFTGKGSLAAFGNLLDPTLGANPAAASAKGWTTFSHSGQLTAFGASLGSTGAEIAVILGGMIFTTLAQVTGILIGLHLKDRHPFAGYTLIVASASSYLTELTSWLTVSIIASNGGAAGSDIAHLAALLGVSPLVISGVMVGVTGAAIITYIGVKKYLKYQRHLRLSAKSLLNEGILSAINAGDGKLFDELMANYPGRKDFERAIEKLSKHMEETSARYLDLQLKTLESSFLQTDGKDATSTAKKGRSYLPNRETFKTLWVKFKRHRIISAYKSELNKLHSYIASSKAQIDLTAQNFQGKEAISQVLQGKYIYEQTGWISQQPRSAETRERLADEYIRAKELVPLHTLVKANIERLQYTDKIAEKNRTERWKTLVTARDFKDLKKRKSWWFSLSHITRHYFISDLQFYLQSALAEFAQAKNDNNFKKMEKITKKILADVLFVPKNLRDIPAAMKSILAYVSAVQAQQRDKIKKYWGLDVVDAASCTVEVDFLCSMAALLYRAGIAEGEEYICPLKAPTSCRELVQGEGLLRRALEAAQTTSSISVTSPALVNP